MIVGVGVDIVDLEDFRARLTDDLIQELFLPDEISYSSSRARPWESYAARFAAKEAVMKALGAGLSQGLSWKDVEVRREESGELGLRMTGAALERARERGAASSRLSVAHSRKSAVAVVVLEDARDAAREGA